MVLSNRCGGIAVIIVTTLLIMPAIDGFSILAAGTASTILAGITIISACFIIRCFETKLEILNARPDVSRDTYSIVPAASTLFLQTSHIELHV